MIGLALYAYATDFGSCRNAEALQVRCCLSHCEPLAAASQTPSHRCRNNVTAVFSLSVRLQLGADEAVAYALKEASRMEFHPDFGGATYWRRDWLLGGKDVTIPGGWRASTKVEQGPASDDTFVFECDPGAPPAIAAPPPSAPAVLQAPVLRTEHMHMHTHTHT